MTIPENEPPLPPYKFFKDSSQATFSFVFGILSIFLLPVIGSIIAIISGMRAKREIRASNGMVAGESKANIGITLGAVSLALFTIAIVVIVVLALLGPNIGRVFSNVVLSI